MSAEPIRRILVALDASADSLAGLEAAAQLASELDAELIGIFVEDEVLLRAGRLAVTREVTLFSSEARSLDENGMERQLRALADRARQALQSAAQRARVSWRFRTGRGRVARVLLEAGEEADLVVVGVRGHSPLRGPGSTVRALLEAARHDVMVLRSGALLGRVVLAVHDGTDAGRRAVRRAAALASREEARLVVLLTTRDEDQARRAREEAEELAREANVRPGFRRAPGARVTALCAAVSESGGGLLVAPAPRYRGERVEALERLLRSAGCPVVLVS